MLKNLLFQVLDLQLLFKNSKTLLSKNLQKYYQVGVDNYKKYYLCNKFFTKMKNIVLIITLSLFSVDLSFAQSLQPFPKGNAQSMQVNEQNLAFKTQADTTLRDHYMRCAGTGKLVLYGYINGGYISGTCATISQSGFDLDFTEHAQFFNYSGSHTVTDVMIWWGAKKVIGLDDDFEVKIYGGRNVLDNANITPLGSQGFNSGQVTAGTQTNFLSNIITFATPVAFTDSFLVSVVCKTPNTDDTLGIVTTNPDSGCGQNEYRFLQKIEDFSAQLAFWDYADNIWQGGFNADLMVLAVVEITQSTGVKNGNLRVYKAYPNPTCETTKLLFELDNADVAQITIYDMSGREIWADKVTAIAGLNEYTVNASNLPNGSYIYNIKTSKGQVTSKIVVSK